MSSHTNYNHPLLRHVYKEGSGCRRQWRLYFDAADHYRATSAGRAALQGKLLKRGRSRAENWASWYSAIVDRGMFTLEPRCRYCELPQRV